MTNAIDFKVFRDLSYGLYIVTSKDGNRLNGQIVNTVMQVTSDFLTIPSDNARLRGVHVAQQHVNYNTEIPQLK